jgi:hypothetical protein
MDSSFANPSLTNHRSDTISNTLLPGEMNNDREPDDESGPADPSHSGFTNQLDNIPNSDETMLREDDIDVSKTMDFVDEEEHGQVRNAENGREMDIDHDNSHPGTQESGDGMDFDEPQPFPDQEQTAEEDAGVGTELCSQLLSITR